MRYHISNGAEKGSIFDPIRFSLGSIHTDQITAKVVEILTDDDIYARYASDPLRYLSEEGIQRDSLTDLEIVNLIQQLRIRATPSPEQNPQQIGVTDQKKEKETKTQWNFDNDKQYISKVEAAYYAERGRTTEKEKQELLQKDEGFKKNGKNAINLEKLIFDDDPDFFPAQPLVAPALFAKIRTHRK